MKHFFESCVKGYEQQKKVKKGKNKQFLSEFGFFFVILHPEKI